jgi:hypothetical protein
MKIKAIYSSKKNLDDIISDLRRQSEGFDARMVICFASAKFAPESLSRQMKQIFKDACVFGCSTAGEMVSGRLLKESVVAMLFSSNSVDDVKIAVVENIRKENRIPEAFRHFEDYCKVPMSEMNFEKYVGIILIDGLSGAQEKLMEKIGDLTNVTFIGASAGDDLHFEKTYLYAEGKSYTDAAVLALIRTSAGFDVIKNQSFRPLDKKLTATKVDEAKRSVLEFNHKPAAYTYAEALKTSLEDAANHFMEHPVGLMFGDEPYVRSPQRIKGDEMRFYCHIKEGMDLRLLQATEITKDTRRAVTKKREELGSISGIVNFDCVLRTLALEQRGMSDAYAKIFSDIPTIGFSTYGEEYIGHINQTSMMLVFK